MNLGDFSPRAGEDEWTAANNAFEEGDAREGDDVGVVGRIGLLEGITSLYAEAERSDVVVRAEKTGRGQGGFLQLFRCFSHEYTECASADRRRLLQCAKISLEYGSHVHLGILYRVYHWVVESTPGTRDPRLTGRHWEVAGFQGEDPRTDLRATGILGLLHIVVLLERLETVAKSWLGLSKSACHGFPFILTGFNLSAMALDGMDTQEFIIAVGKTEKRCDEYSSRPVFWTAAFLYLGCWSAFVDEWSLKERSITDFGLVKASVKKTVLADQRSAIHRGRRLAEGEAGSEIFSSLGSPNSGAQAATSGEVVFSTI